MSKKNPNLKIITFNTTIILTDPLTEYRESKILGTIHNWYKEGIDIIFLQEIFSVNLISSIPQKLYRVLCDQPKSFQNRLSNGLVTLVKNFLN